MLHAMHLKHLVLNGYKTFANKTAFDFNEGVTAVIGPNGSGKCVIGDTLVTLADGRQAPIRQLVETALAETQAVETLDDGALTHDNPQRVSVLSLNPETLCLEQRPVTAFVRRQAPASLLHIRTRSGREITATPYHPLFTLEKGRLRALRADELEVGTRIALPRRLPVQGQSVTFPLMEVLGRFNTEDRIYLPNSSSLHAWAQKGREQFGTWAAWEQAANVPHTQFVGLLNEQAVNADVLTRLSTAVQMAPPLVTGIKSSNSGSAVKEVPAQIFLAEDEVIWSFLSGLFEGDAYICAKGSADGRRTQAYIEYVSASEKLARGVVSLLLRVGIFARLRVKQKAASNTVEKRKRPYYSVLIYGNQQLQHSAQHLTFVGDKAAALELLRQLPSASNPNLDLVPGVTPLVKEASRLAGVKLKPNRRYHARLAAYMEQRCEASRDGLRMVIRDVEQLGANAGAAQSLLTHLQRLAASDIYWDEIASVEQVAPPEEWVYDLCIADTHNFVAGDIVVHNSNVADSIRWALGEQQFSLLRGKKTDDMIFAGSARRPRASMAEVLLTFDNSDGFFPVEFTEIAIGRRAYRDGTNEYLLNGNRVRLRDITDLLGHTGLAERTYTVIGQGLVDTALTQRPEERRALFEEAAGIGAYRDRRDDALRKLEETQHNLERVRDILTEITPRVHQLERQATRARQYQVFSAQLIELTRAWFSFHYRSAKVAVDISGAARDQLQLRVDEARTVVEALEQQANQLQVQQSDLRARVSEVLPRRDEARRHNEAVSRDLAVLRERAASVQSQLSAARRELAERRQALNGLTIRAAHASAVLIGTQATLSQRQAELDVAESAATERQAARAALEKARAGAQDELTRAASALGGVQNRLNALRARQTVLTKQRSDLAERSNRSNDQREREAKTLAELNATLESDAVHLREMNSEHELLTRELEAARALTSAAQSALAAAEAEEKMANRMHQFAELRQQGGGELADQARAAHLPGLRGTLASLVHVLPDDQRAVEAALGDLMKAVVIESSEGVTRTRAWLITQKARNTRLGIIPLPAMRPPVAERALLDAALVERARALHARPLMESISAPEWLKSALQVLVGRAFITRELDAARTLAAQLPEGALCVTRDGEVVYASGLLSLPPGPRTPVILGEEPKQEQAPLIDPVAAKANREQAAQARDRAQHDQDVARRKLDEHTRMRDTFSREASVRRSRRDDAARRITSLEEQLAQMAGDIEQAQRDLSHTTEQVTGISTTVTQHEEAHAQAARHLATIEAELREHMAGGWMESLNAAHAAVASATEGLRSAQNMRRERLSALAEGRTQRDSRARLLTDLDSQHTAAQAKLQTVEQETSTAAAQLHELDELLQPIQAELTVVEKQLAGVESQRREAEHTLRGLESQLNTTLLDLARHNDELEALYERAADSMELDDRQADAANGNGNGEPPAAAAPATPADVSNVTLQSTSDAPQTASVNPETPGAESPISNPQSPLPNPEAVAAERRASIIRLLDALPEVSTLPEGMDERITHVRNQIKRLGAINFEAQAEYDDLSQRHTFLTEQTADLERASVSLQQVIVELNDVMQATFKQTFEAIATAFQSTFKVLFGGGQARLNMTNADNIDEAGIEIHAQPPGKRPQGLALLSGGERSLTAAALLFAILRVKPTPFCVLDEVDAALDEANVGRFRNMLESLGEQTQFIIITHNRRTVEAAGTVYGISMGADGASTALSLQLDEAAEATAAANGG